MDLHLSCNAAVVSVEIGDGAPHDWLPLSNLSQS
jgi:hypothetical protein